MKKIFTLTLVFLAMMFGVNAQYLLQEGFETGTLPTGWTTIDNDGDGYTWDASYLYQQSPSQAHAGDGMISSASYVNNVGALTPDNWLITPAINLTANATLTFWVCAQDASWASEHYGVYISTTGTSTSNFTLVYEETMDANGGPRDQGAWKQKTVDLSSYTGQTIYIAFRHFNCTDMFWFNLDDVEIFAQPSGPAISANPSIVNFGTILLGNTANATVNITTYNLTAPVTASTTAPFEISADGTTYGTTASIAAAGGTLYLRYTPTAAGTDNGTVTLSSTGATNITVTLAGSGLDCGNTTIPYNYNFDNESMFECWQIVNANNDDKTFTLGDGYIYYTYSSTAAADDWLISPSFVLTGNEMGSFDYWVGLSSYPERFEVYALGADTVLLVSPVDANNVSTAPITQYFGLSNLTGSYRIGIHCISDADQYRLYISNFSIFSAGSANITVNPATIDFGVLPTGNTTSSTVDLTILNATDNITVSTAAPFSVSLDNTTYAASVTIPTPTNTVLNQTIYVAYSPTAAGTHNGQVTISTTGASETVNVSGTGISCDVVTTFPFTETFNEDSPTRECWTIVDANNDDNTISYAAYDDINTGVAAYFYSETSAANDWLISPEMTIPTGGAFLSYDYAIASSTYPEKYSVWVIPQNSTYTNAINILPTQIVNESGSINNNFLDLSNYANQTIKIAFKFESDADMYWIFIDNVTVSEAGVASMTVDPASMFFSGLVNTPTGAQTANVVAMSLTNDITITATAPFEVSTNGTTFASTGTIAQASIVNTPIYVRMNATTAGAQSGTVTLTSGSLTATINVSGTAMDCSSAQNLPFTENFETDLSECWIILDEDGDSYSWMNGGMAAYEGDGCISSASYINNIGALYPDNWLITPTLAIPSQGAELSFYVVAQDASYAEEHYGVYVSTSGVAPSDFTLLYEEDLDADGGPREQGTWKQKTVNLPYGGQNIHIAIRHFNVSDMFWINIDNFSVVAGNGDGIESHELNTKVYPNPANNVLNINANCNINNVEVYNMMGQMVGSYNVNDVNTQISTTSFANGVYTMKIETENGTTTKKFTVAR